MRAIRRLAIGIPSVVYATTTYVWLRSGHGGFVKTAVIPRDAFVLDGYILTDYFPVAIVFVNFGLGGDIYDGGLDYLGPVDWGQSVRGNSKG
ncbi:hypothetical protein NEOLEDRAFT_1143389 [Neolentinus lepideus HHB14362 ss-1]|uniref:Uncharacterized protein n=1 Tax=Neolentinus lepideus HHB14362 ss-1 TaxID=1314782 RepID=A0A165MKM5_9AGAM|nr:hypothetical protein NEOLEDRAFT_1143389 [Neolentinus lepideus HHB14362 ss-1]